MLCTCITASTCECICIYIDTLAIYPPTPADSKGERARSFRLERRRHHHHQRRQPQQQQQQQQQRSARLPPTPPQNPSGWMCFLIFRGPGWKKRTIKLQDAFWISFWALVGGFLLFFFGACQEPQHCNLQCFCAFGMQEILLATCWKLRKYKSFC